jgi:hypothetical protein
MMNAISPRGGSDPSEEARSRPTLERRVVDERWRAALTKPHEYGERPSPV